MNKAEFEQKLAEAGKPVVVDFWATWCGPCMMTKPILENLSKEYSDKVLFIPVNADDSRELLEQFHVFGIPTVLTMRDNKEVGRVTGAQNEAGYRTIFESLAAGKEVKVPLTIFDRMLRLGAGTVFIMIGVINGNWLIAGIGALLAFLGIYDRCPIWNAVTKVFKRA